MMTEDEEFQLLEAKLAAARELRAIKESARKEPPSLRAVVAAQKFIEDNAKELGIMTLRKAFEMGYRAGSE